MRLRKHPMLYSASLKFLLAPTVLLLALNLPSAANDARTSIPEATGARSAGMNSNAAVDKADSPFQIKILFIGNSLTFAQQGIYAHLEKLAASASPAIAIRTEKSVKGGATLKTHWERKEPREMIASGSYDVVVLQEDLPEINVDYFRQFGRQFVGEIRKAKSRPILLMAWSYPRLGWISTEEIAKAHRAAAKEFGAEVAPVALAWQRSMKERPDLDLYVADREHPSICGTYLATSVVYATLFGKSPVDLRYVPAGISDEAAAWLRRVAWETCQKWTKEMEHESSETR